MMKAITVMMVGAAMMVSCQQQQQQQVQPQTPVKVLPVKK